MSLSKELCLRSDSQNSDSFSDCLVNKFESKEDNYRRDSFCDRFCDDLCEDILQYLSLEDKLKIQCVSKQIQRTVFKRQYELFVHITDPRISTFGFGQNFRDRRDYYYISNNSDHRFIEYHILDSFKALLKKCPNITSLELKGSYYRNSEYISDKINEVFRLIIENCNNLSEIIVMDVINDSNFEELQRKFGQKLKYFRFNGELYYLSPLFRFPNIEKIKFRYLNDISIVRQLNLAKLKQLKLTGDFDQQLWLQTVIDTFPTLTHFSVFVRSGEENTIYKPLKNISNLKHLIHFQFLMGNGIDNHNNGLNGLLKQMANICRNLRSIDCRYILDVQNSDIRQLLFQLKAFPLKRLNLDLIFISDKSSDSIDVNQLFSFELFEGFENITHLRLHFHWRPILKESILKDIDIYLPKLQYLEIKYRFDATPEVVTQMVDILSRLSRLQTIHLVFKSGVDFKPIEEQITKKCRKIKEIKLSNI